MQINSEWKTKFLILLLSNEPCMYNDNLNMLLFFCNLNYFLMSLLHKIENIEPAVVIISLYMRI